MLILSGVLLPVMSCGTRQVVDITDFSGGCFLDHCEIPVPMLGWKHIKKNMINKQALCGEPHTHDIGLFLLPLSKGRSSQGNGPRQPTLATPTTQQVDELYFF